MSYPSNAESGEKTMVSVVVIGKDEAPGLADCFRSVREALADVPHELIFVDGGSRDDSLAIAEAAGARCFRVRSADTTPGLSRRAGTREAGGAFILFLDGDMRLEPGFTEAALAVLEVKGSEGIGGVAGIRRDVYLRGDREAGEDPNYYRCTFRREARAFGGAILLRATVLENVGGWAANLIACEESELHARLLRSGARVVELPVPMIRHFDRVRENRGLLGALLNWRRLGLGQALREAARRGGIGGLWAMVRREGPSCLCWALDVLCVLSLCVVGLRAAWRAALLVQAIQVLAFVLRGNPRGFVGQKLLLPYLPAGVFSYRVRDEGYGAWLSAQAQAEPEAEA
jgi:glycosyltransferase involved in cell wall biosynthesis